MDRYSSLSAISSLICASLILFAFFFSSHFTSFINFSLPSKLLQNSSSVMPTVQLQAAKPSTITDGGGGRGNTVSADLIIRAVRSSVDRPLAITSPSLTKKKVLRTTREEMMENGLARARATIQKASSAPNKNVSHSANGIYRNAGAFYQSYAEMERRFKVYVYTEGEVPLFHYGPCKHIYSVEGRFLDEMEHGGTRFRTKDAHLAHVYYLPFSVTWMVKYLFDKSNYSWPVLRKFVGDYVKVISTKHPFWNITQGADHFMLSCHDWGPAASEGNPFLYNTSIRVLCNANASEGFNPQRDVSIPEIVLYGGVVSPKLLSPPPDNASRPHLAFFAGGVHGSIRPILFQHWEERDPDILVYQKIPKDKDYNSLLVQSKFCLCPSGHEVASPRIVEAIYGECVPIILSEHYVLPFSDVLRWEAFSVQVNVSDIPRLKEILRSIPEEKYRRLKEGVKAVRKHFELNHPAKKFDLFHMMLHSIWLRRLNLRLIG